jgi:hypothetical protein
VPRYQAIRQSKARLDYDVSGSTTRYEDTYSERLVDIWKLQAYLLYILFYKYVICLYSLS